MTLAFPVEAAQGPDPSNTLNCLRFGVVYARSYGLIAELIEKFNAWNKKIDVVRVARGVYLRGTQYPLTPIVRHLPHPVHVATGPCGVNDSLAFCNRSSTFKSDNEGVIRI